jgi:hypothetical protein
MIAEMVAGQKPTANWEIYQRALATGGRAVAVGFRPWVPTCESWELHPRHRPVRQRKSER